MFSRSNLRFRQIKSNVVMVPQEDGSLGITNLKLVFAVLINFNVDVIAAIKSRSWFAMVQILYGLLQYGNIIELGRVAWEEFKDLSQEETEELNAHFAVELDLENDVVEAKIEQAVSIIPRVYMLVNESIGIVGAVTALYAEARDIFGPEGDIEEETAA